MKYDLVIFDMDGTVLDTLGDLTAALNHTLRGQGFPEHTRDEVKSYIGNGVKMLLKRGAPEGTDDKTLAEMYKTYVEYYFSHLDVSTKPYDGITELLHKLGESGVKRALLSNKTDMAARSLCDEYFPGLFDLAHGEREGVPRKPAPDGVFEILREIGIPAERTLYVGDSGVDLETARRAGLDCVIVDWGYLNSEVTLNEGREFSVSSTDEIERIIFE
ncbi:MAG: HAD family hydrolase [Clostridia bacterium]|nr:HAD family hydrolase [Clostridia bacterium]